MKLRQFLISITVATLVAFAGHASAGLVQDGDAANAAAADTYLDIVFAIDTSGSMSDEASAISTNVQSALVALECPSIDIWVNAKFVGLDGTWPSTLFDEVAETVLSTAGDTVTIDDSEDNGPVVLDFANATNYWVNPGNPGQKYQKAVVTIGDEGLEDGSTTQTQADYDIGGQANAAAIANDVLVFSIIGNNVGVGHSPGSYAAMQELFTALAEGGATLQGVVFNNTGGFAIQADDSQLQTRLEEVLCTAGTGGRFETAAPIPTMSWWSLIALASLLAFAGYRGMRRFA